MCSTRTKTWATLAAAFLMSCTSCGFESTDSEPYPDEVVVRRAVSELRRSFNAGSCAAVYDSASDSLKEQLSPEQWIDECQHLRSELGPWGSFGLSRVDRPNSDLISFEASAEFRRHPAHIMVVWQIEEGEPRFVQLYVSEDGRTLSLPPKRHPLRMDPPMTPPSELTHTAA